MIGPANDRYTRGHRVWMVRGIVVVDALDKRFTLPVGEWRLGIVVTILSDGDIHLKTTISYVHRFATDQLFNRGRDISHFGNRDRAA